MTTLDRLLNRLTRVYDTTPDPILGLRLTYPDGFMAWSIAHDTLTTTIIGGMGSALTVPLADYTISTLADFLAGQPGYVVPYLDNSGLSSLSALALVPGSGDTVTSNGDHILIGRNPTWTHLAAVAAELRLLQEQIEVLPLETATTTADGQWLDLLGSYYAVPRLLAELDAQYGPRIPAEVILPRQNNVAIAMALQVSTGQPATVLDAPSYGNPEPNFSGSISFDGAPHFFNATAGLVYNLFDITIGYDLLGGLAPEAYIAAVRSQVDRLRAAGTHLVNLTLTPSVMGDTLTEPTDSLTTDNLQVAGLQASASSIAIGFATLSPADYSGGASGSDSAAGSLTALIRLVGPASSANTATANLGPRDYSGGGTSSNQATAPLTAKIVLSSSRISINSAVGTLL